MEPPDWNQIIVGLSTLGAAIGAALGQMLNNWRARQVIDTVWAEKEAALVKRIKALEDHNGWNQRK